jgi:hypothetical protein
MSLWQYAAALDGYVKGQGGGDKAEAPSDDEFMAWIKGEA